MFNLQVTLTNDQVNALVSGLRAIHRHIANEFSKDDLSPQREDLLTQTYAATSAVLTPLQEHLQACREADAKEAAQRRADYKK